MPSLVLGPMLRYVGDRDATIWVETSAPCEVSVLGCSAPTFAVAGHHYALVHCAGLEPGTSTPYEVTLDGEVAWPQADSEFPASVVRTTNGAASVKLIFGSCRVSAPHEEPYSLRKDEDEAGREVDALRNLAMRMRDSPVEDWPHTLIMLGDQVYADEVSPKTREDIKARRDTSLPPYETIADFEEYTMLYREAWGEPYMRWLLSTVATAMIFDDHDVHDDWNTSIEWITEIRATGWWDRRIVGGFSTYWLYQHLGNLSPDELDANELYCRVREDAADATQVVFDFAFCSDRQVEGVRWSFARDIGSARLVMVDSRAGRVLDPGRRSMVDDDEFAWIEEQVSGDFDHLLIGTSLPLLLAPGMHYLEAWNERLCDGKWGPVGTRVGEKLRQGLDMEHWAAFGDSFDRMCALIEEVATGRRGRAPATVVTLSGDVHHAYLAEVGFPTGTRAQSNVWQATCSPFRNPLDSHEQRMIRFATSKAGTLVGRTLAKTAGVPDPRLRWRFVHDAPWFNNQVATLEIDGRVARMRLEKTLDDASGAVAPGQDPKLRLEPVFEHALA